MIYFKPSAEGSLISLLVTDCIQDKGTSARARFRDCPVAPPTQKYHGNRMLNLAVFSAAPWNLIMRNVCANQKFN